MTDHNLVIGKYHSPDKQHNCQLKYYKQIVLKNKAISLGTNFPKNFQTISILHFLIMYEKWNIIDKQRNWFGILWNIRRSQEKPKFLNFSVQIYHDQPYQMLCLSQSKSLQLDLCYQSIDFARKWVKQIMFVVVDLLVKKLWWSGETSRILWQMEL